MPRSSAARRRASLRFASLARSAPLALVLGLSGCSGGEGGRLPIGTSGDGGETQSDGAVAPRPDATRGETAGSGDGAPPDLTTARADAAIPDGATGTPVTPAGAHPFVITRVRFHPRAGAAAKMVGGRFQGSNTGPTNDFVDLATVVTAPAEGAFTELAFQNQATYRWVKYYGPKDSHATVAELEFYAGDRRLTGAPFGTNGARAGTSNTFDKALDGKTETYFDAAFPSDAYVGIDLGAENQAKAPAAAPAPGAYKTAQSVTLASATAGATIRYTLDGSTPSASKGSVYAGAIAVDRNLTLSAIAVKDGLVDSPLFTGFYRVGESAAESKGFTTFHIGNSLTDTINAWLDPIADSAGYKHSYYRSTIPGAPTDYLWGASRFNGENFRTAFVTRAPIDHLVTQPFAGHCRDLENEVAAGGKFYALARQKSPNVQHWVYVQWPSHDEYADCWSRASSADMKRLGRLPAKNWEEAVANHVAYTEAVRDKMDATVDGPPIGLVPGGQALVALKQEIDAGRFPGMSNFFALFNDGLHLKAPAAYLVGLVHFSCFYKRSPEGIVTAANTGLTEAQAKAMQQIAWRVASSHKWCVGP